MIPDEDELFFEANGDAVARILTERLTNATPAGTPKRGPQRQGQKRLDYASGILAKTPLFHLRANGCLAQHSVAPFLAV
jgi:hypothetical protein